MRTARIPRSMMTSDNVLAIYCKNEHTFPGGVRFEAGDLLVFDMERCPKHGDIVLLIPHEGEPFTLECAIAPLELQPREFWSPGLYVKDGEFIELFNLGEFAQFGVYNGKVPESVAA